MTGLIDAFGREITYLRVSVTDKCNLRCIYCMPEEGVPPKSHSDILRIEEFARIARIASQLGITHVRLTGGEPLVRKGILTLVHLLSSTMRTCLPSIG
jgi:cyclic pyranopterin phosphate synthase